ncbi:MAG: hypothetical protein LC127_01145 [Chitinophagales bacterium]|nr:hypothetical protein [Chitinophagales bacterium]
MRKISLVLIICCNILQAQNTPNIIPPTPEIASLGKFIDQQMSLSTGVPNISIPIYNIYVSGELSYPISLNYIAGGIRVNEIASKVGLGWNISGMGMISRTVKGLPDDIQNKGFINSTRNIASIMPILENTSSANYLLLPDILDANDMESDEYSLSVNGINFKFYYDKNNSRFISTPLNDHILEPEYSNNGTILTWKLISNAGITYYFGTNGSVEKYENTDFITKGTIVSASDGGIPSYISTWYLTKIVDTKLNIIDFQFMDKENYYLYTKTDEYFRKNYNSIFVTNYNYDLTDFNSNKISTYTRTYVKEKVLSKISSNDIEVVFVDDLNSRLDLYKNKSLKEITIRHKDSIITKAQFDYDYFISDNTLPYDNTYYSSQDDKRLKLLGLRIYEGNKLSPLIYKFEYDPTNLPNRFSFAQDAWGFFNGMNNTELIPKINLKSFLNIDAEIGSAIRNVKVEKARAAMLTKIIYPTGGYNTFTYEGNRISKIARPADIPITALSEFVTKNLLFEADIIDNQETIVVDDKNYTKRFTVNNTFGSLTFITNIEPCTNSYQNSNCNYSIKIVGVGNTYNTTFLNQRDLSVNLPTGEYELIATHNYNKSHHFGFQVTAYWQELVGEDGSAFNPLNQNVGGLRLNKTSFYDSDNTYLYTKSYDYNDNLPNQIRSSGKIIEYPLFIEYPYYVNLTKSFRVSSNSIFPLSNLMAHNITYTKVTERTFNENTNISKGRTEYEFSFDDLSDLISPTSNSNNLKNKSNYSMSWRNGLLLSKQIFDDDDNPLQLIKNKYLSKRRIFIENFGGLIESREIKSLNHLPGWEGIDFPRTYFRYNIYNFLTEFNSIDTSTVTDFNENTEITNTTIHLYENPAHYQLTSQKTTFPDLSTQETNYQYAHEKNNQKLIDANMVGIPLETTTFKNNVPLSKVETIYPDQNNFPTIQAGNLLLPLSVRCTNIPTISILNPPVGEVKETEVTYDLYDTKGNLLQYTSKNRIPTAIIWGYNQTQPIAKIEGATYAQVSLLAATIVNASDYGNPNYSEANLINELDAFRKNVLNYQVSTYTYKPLIGVTSITPPSGIREIYNYDTANRLQSIKDIDGKILKEYSYKYKQ